MLLEGPNNCWREPYPRARCCVGAGVTGSLALWDARSSIDRLFVSLASMYLSIKLSTIQSFKCLIFHPSTFLFKCNLSLQ